MIACLLMTSSVSAWWSLEQGPAPEVEVTGGVAVEVAPGRVTVVVTSPDVRVELRTANGHNRPRELRLDLVNVGAGSLVTGIDAGERLVHEGRSARVTVDPALGWPRTVGASLASPGEGAWSFLAMGDPQGHDWNLGTAATIARATGARFVLLLGDVTASGLQEQYESLERALDGFDVPVYATPGNHDRMNLGGARFQRLFGATQCAFVYGGARFVLLDTSNNTFGERERADLARMARGVAGERLIVATHTSPVDTRPGAPHAFVNEGGAKGLMEAVEEAGASLLLAGHVHMYCSTATPGGVPVVVTGGGGGSFVGVAPAWEFNHVVEVDVRSSLGWRAVPFVDGGTPEGAANVTVELTGPGLARVSLSVEELLPLAVLEGCWSFENRYGNWAPGGVYRAVPMDTLVGLVGGVGAGGVVEVRAIDGYVQMYSGANVLGTGPDARLQGRMALAVSLDGEAPPGWRDGPRVIFTPGDGAYSNADAVTTTDPGHMSDPFSAGTRWARQVAAIAVIGAG